MRQGGALNDREPEEPAGEREDEGSLYRVERDSMGEMQVPWDALWGAQTQRAVANFPISGIRFGRRFIHALGSVKRACALANEDLALLAPDVTGAIVAACDEVIRGDLDAHFPLDVFQTGSGTSTNMNANEVIAMRAMQVLAGAQHSQGSRTLARRVVGRVARVQSGRSCNSDPDPPQRPRQHEPIQQ